MRAEKIEKFSAALSHVGRETFFTAVVDFSRHPAAVWVEVLGIYLWRRGAGCGDRTVLGPAGVCGDSGLWADGDDVADQCESSVQVGEGIDWEGAAGARCEAGGGWRDFDSRRWSGVAILGSGVARRASPTSRAGITREMWARWMTAGNLYFKGRKKEVIVTPAGLNIYPEDLEAALRRQPEVKDCVVVGIERGGNAEPCAVVILRDDAKVEEVVERANQSLAEFQRMRMWVQWPQEDFPRTSTQKPRRNVIAGFAAKQILQGAEENAGDDPVMELIGRITGRKAAAVNAEETLDSDLGLSSLDRVELISALEDRYQLDLSEVGFSAARHGRRCRTHAAWRGEAAC